MTKFSSLISPYVGTSTKPIGIDAFPSDDEASSISDLDTFLQSIDEIILRGYTSKNKKRNNIRGPNIITPEMKAALEKVYISKPAMFQDLFIAAENEGKERENSFYKLILKEVDAVLKEDYWKERKMSEKERNSIRQQIRRKYRRRIVEDRQSRLFTSLDDSYNNNSSCYSEENITRVVPEPITRKRKATELNDHKSMLV